MAKTYMSEMTLPVNVSGTVSNVTFTIKDAEARDAIAALGDVLYWIGVTTTVLTDGATTSPIVVNSEEVTPKKGGMAQYNGEEFIWNGSAWQSAGKANFGSLAFKNSASGSYTPAGTVNVNQAADTKVTVNSITAVGTLPSYTLSGETVVFNPGTLPTRGADQSVVSASGAVSATFSGTAATVTVS